MAIGGSDAELRFKAQLDDEVSPKIDRLEKKLREMGASQAEIKMMLKAYDEITPKLDEVQKQMDKMPKEQIVNIKAETSGVTDQLGAVRKAAEEPIRLSFVDNLKETMNGLFNLRTKMTLPGGMPGLGGVTPMLYGVGAGGIAAGAGAAAFGAVQQGIQVNQQMEQSMVTLTQTLRDSAQAKSEMQELIGFAQKTPFAYQDVLQGDVRLRSYQIPTMPGEGGPGNQGWLQSAGDMAAAMGTPLTQAVEAIADARQGYFVRMMSYGIRMMREDFQKGGKYAGLSYEQGLERALKRFDGSMEMQSKTFTGVMSNIQDIIQQQFYQPVGQEPFGIVSNIASSAYEMLNDPDTLRKIGQIMEEIQKKQESIWMTVQKGADLFRAHMQEPLKEILMNIIEIGKVFSSAFGGATLEIVKTVATALGTIANMVTNILSGIPGFIQLYGTMKALSMLGFHGIADPFFLLLKAVNPLTFSFIGLGKSLVALPGMFTKLGIYLLVKSFIDAKEAAAAFNRQFEDMNEMSLEKLNTQVEMLALNLGTSATEMRNLATYAGQAMEGTTPKEGLLARGSLYAAKQAEYMRERFGTDPMDTIQMVTDEIKASGMTPTQGNLEKLYTQANRTASSLEALGVGADQAGMYLGMFGKQAAQAGFNRFGAPDEIAALQLGLGNLTDKQVEMYKNPTNMIRSMLGVQGTPAVTDVQTLIQRGGSVFDYFGMNNSIFQASGNGRSPVEKAFRNLQRVPGEGTSIDEVYLANEAAKGDAQRMVSRLAPSVTLPRIDNPWLDQGVGGGLNMLAPGSGASQKDQITAITREWTQADQVLQGLNTQIEKQQQKITELTNQQVVYQQAQDLVNRDLQVYQHQITVANRAVEDLSLSMQQWQLDNLRPLERQMQMLSNESTILSNNMTLAQREMQKYSTGLLEGEQAVLNQSHALEMYNKQLQLLKLSYTSIGAELGRTQYERGFSSRVEPMAGLSLSMQMERLQREQERNQLEYDLTYGEQHYQMQQAARSKFERTERPFEERMQHIKASREEIDKLTVSQFKLGQEQFTLGQKMFKANQYMADQQDKLTQLQINMTAMQQSGSYRALQDEQYKLQMKLGDVNRELELQNMNLTQRQNIMDDLKSRKEQLGELFADVAGASGDTNYEKMKSMLQMARDLGTITEHQYRESMKYLRQTRGNPVENVLGDPRSDVEKWFDTFKQTLVGLFSGQTWSAIGQVVKTGLMEVLGKTIGGAIGGPLATIITAGGTGYSLLTGVRLAGSLGRYGALSAVARVADRAEGALHARGLPMMSPALGRRLQGASEFLSNRIDPLNETGRAPRFAAWLGSQGDDLVNARSDIGGLIRGPMMRGSLSEAITRPFRLLNSLRFAGFRGPASMAARVAGFGPFSDLIGGTAAQYAADNTTFRGMGGAAMRGINFIRSPIESMRGVFGAADDAARTVGPITKFFEKIGGLVRVVAESPITRFAGKALGAIGVAVTAVQAIGDLFDVFQGEADKGDWFRLGGMTAGAVAGGFIGGPLGALAGAGLGQVGGDLLSKVDWNEVKDFMAKHVVDFLTSPWVSALEGLDALLGDVPVLGNVITALKDAAVWLREGFQFLLGGAAKGMWAGVKWAANALWDVGKWLVGAAKDIWDFIHPIRKAVGWVADKLWDGVKKYVEFSIDVWKGIWGIIKKIGNFLADVAHLIGKGAEKLWGWVKDAWEIVKKIANGIADIASDFWDGVQDAADGFADIIHDAAEEVAYIWSDLLNAIVDVVNKISPFGDINYTSEREKEEALQRNIDAASARDQAAGASIIPKGYYNKGTTNEDRRAENKRTEDDEKNHRRNMQKIDEDDKAGQRQRDREQNSWLETAQKMGQKTRLDLQKTGNKDSANAVRDGMRSSRDNYNNGWKSIFGVTKDWIGDVAKAIKGIDEDLGLTKPHTGASGDPKNSDVGHHGDDLTVPAHAAGGMVAGDKYNKKGQIIRVGEEGFGEVVIPLAPHRRDRARNLMKMAHAQMGEFANGGFTIREGHMGQDLAYHTAKGAYEAAKQFASGGFTGPHGSLAGMTPVANLAASKFGLQVTAGKDDHSTSTASGNTSDHSWGGALDLSNGTSPTPQMDAWWKFLHSKLGKVYKQIIYKHMGSNTGPSDWYYSPTDHFNHVHTAMLEQYASNAPLMAKVLSAAMKGVSIDALLKGGAGGIGGGVTIPTKQLKKLEKMGKLGQRVKQAYDRKAKQWQEKVGAASGIGGVAGAGMSAKALKKLVGAGELPEFLRQYNHLYEEHSSDMGDYSGPTMPPEHIAALAEWAGKVQGISVPGWTMEQITKGESGGRPGSSSASGGDGSDEGWGMWAITEPYWKAEVQRMGGYPQMLNPIKNALIMAQIWKSQGQGAWYGTRFVTDWNKHYTGPLTRQFAGGIGRVPSTGGAMLHEGEMVLPVGLADLFRSMAKGNRGGVNFGNYEEQVRTYKRITEHLEDIRAKTKKVQKHLENAEDKDEKTKWKEKLAKMEERQEKIEQHRVKVRQQMGKSTEKRISAMGDDSGGEDTLAGVTEEQQEYRAMVQKAVESARDSKKYRNQVRQARKARKKIADLKEDGITKREREKIEDLKKELDDPKHVVNQARNKAYRKYLRSAAHQGIAPDLVEQITHREMSKKQLKRYEDQVEGKAHNKDRGGNNRSTNYEERSLALLETLAAKDTHVNLDVHAQGAKVEAKRKPSSRRRK